ncbi:MAG: OmpA family protein [Phenylobacterium sp.]|uniref:OmpA family protein n=1 Tax=Phenylobacterium sp. TaxID=1871053 RepID=UPI001A53ECF5|nr:OmpA family protein [Phenylobacterium sp.]MBL8770852.1 OmpA family protein [Phenylobacterium sp.]
MRAVVAAAAAALVAGCASQSVTLLNNEGGGQGAVAVLDPETGRELGQVTTADTEASLGRGSVEAKALRKDRKPWFGDLVARVPYAPETYVLYFYEGTTDITAESESVLAALREALKPDSEVQITGHTDTVGDAALNDRLSVERAQQIRTLLAASGLPTDGWKVTGRGERELLVATGDGVDEQANRRVEVVIRY